MIGVVEANYNILCRKQINLFLLFFCQVRKMTQTTSELYSKYNNIRN